MKRTRLRRFSKKRAAKMATQAKERRERGEPTRHPGPCEVTPLLEGVAAWEKWLADYLAGRPDAEREFHVHHVWKQRAAYDESWNRVVVSEAAHDFIHRGWGVAGELVCLKALSDRGALLPEPDYRNRLGFYPVGRLYNAVAKGVFNREPALIRYAHELLTAYGYDWPALVPHPDDFGFGL